MALFDIQEKEKQMIEADHERKRSVERWIRSKQDNNKRNSTQMTLTFNEITQEGIIVADNRYTQIIEFTDINYQLAPEERQIEIFNEWCSFLNYFDSAIDFQLLFYNREANDIEMKDHIKIHEQFDDFQDIREEYNEFLQNQLKKGNDRLIKRKYIAYTVEAKDKEEAYRKLSRIEIDVNAKLLNLNSQNQTLNFSQVIALLHKILNPDEPRKLADYQTIIESGLSSKDMVSPMSMHFAKSGDKFKLNNSYNTIGYMEILASEMSDRMLAELTDLEDNNLLISLSIKAMEQYNALKFVKTKVSDIDAMKIEEQKKAARSGYDTDILPPELRTSAEESQKLLDDLQTRNERAFLVTITIMTSADSNEKLKESIYQLKALCQKYNIIFRIPNYQMEEALMTTLPFGLNQMHLDRMLTTSSTGIFIPFTTQELYQREGSPVYYGINPLSNNMIRADRKQLRNPNGLFLGTPGSGKSFGAKREITDAFLTTDDDIIILDPESEYAPLVNALGGQIITLTASSKNYINPLDININYADDDDPVALKTDFITSLLELVLGGQKGFDSVERSIITKVTGQLYLEYFSRPTDDNMPILEDLYNALNAEPEQEAKRMAKGLEMYVYGAFSFFNNQTNVDLSNRIVCFDIRGLGTQLKKIAMLTVQDQIWNRVSTNRDKKITTRVYIDEFHLLMKDEQTANFSMDIWKRFRKWNGIPSGITQNVKDLLGSPTTENIFDNSDFVLLYNQASGDRDILVNKLKISPSQQTYITNSPAGEGLIIYGDVKLPFKDDFPKDTKLYKLLSTKPGES